MFDEIVATIPFYGKLMPITYSCFRFGDKRKPVNFDGYSVKLREGLDTSSKPVFCIFTDSELRKAKRRAFGKASISDSYSTYKIGTVLPMQTSVQQGMLRGTDNTSHILLKEVTVNSVILMKDTIIIRTGEPAIIVDRFMFLDCELNKAKQRAIQYSSFIEDKISVKQRVAAWVNRIFGTLSGEY